MIQAFNQLIEWNMKRFRAGNYNSVLPQAGLWKVSPGDCGAQAPFDAVSDNGVADFLSDRQPNAKSVAIASIFISLPVSEL